MVSLERRHKKRRRESRAAQGTPSRPLRGGPRTYARLSVLRGGFRSLAPVLAGVCAAVLFCQLSGIVIRYDGQLRDLRANSSVRGNMTDISGKYTTDLVLDEQVLEDNLRWCGKDRAWLERTAQANTLLPEEILLLIGNETEDYFLLRKERCHPGSSE